MGRSFSLRSKYNLKLYHFFISYCLFSKRSLPCRKLLKSLSTFQDTFCGLLTIDCPGQSDFDAMDGNDDGNLTFQEYMEANFEN